MKLSEPAAPADIAPKQEALVPVKALVTICSLAIAYCPLLLAQDSKLNTSLGGGLSVPANSTARLAGTSLNAVVGAGYNFTKHHSIIGEFMWSGLRPKKDALRPIWIAAQSREISGSSNLFAVTSNYRFRLQGKVFGVYVIGGGGVYYRHSRLSKEVDVARGSICQPLWYWWGYACVSGTVSEDQTLVSAGSTAFGGNAGIGFTIRVDEDGLKFYVESRYHYAPHKNVPTRLFPITFGFRW